MRRSHAAQRRVRHCRAPGGRSVHLPPCCWRGRTSPAGKGAGRVVEAVMLWNEPNNLSHWDFEIDPEWRMFADLVKTSSAAVAAERPGLRRVLGGMSPIDPGFVRTLDRHGVLDAVDVVAVHGFPLDWNHWQIG